MDVPILAPFKEPAVFISSKIKVFSVERSKLAALIGEKFRWRTFLFESTSRPHPSRDVYKAAIEQSQIFLGIYGTGYGWIDTENGMQISGIHDEWCIATECKMPRLAFVQETNKQRDPRLEELIKEIQQGGICTTVFDTRETLYRKVIESLDVLVSEYVFAGVETYAGEIPDYSVTLVDRYKSEYIIETSFFQDQLCPLVENNRKVYVYGAQGSGKTVALMLLAKSYPNIYISLRNRSLLQVLAYIANRISVRSGRGIPRCTSVGDAFTKCEQLLRHEEIFLIIDEADQNLDVARSLFDLEIGKSKVIFAGRKNIVHVDIVSIECTGFNRVESESYVLNVAPDADIALREEAIQKSHGNPQYLAYYCHRYKQKPPDSLDSYHAVIYDHLVASSQEILAIISVCECLVTVDELAEGVSRYRGVPTSAIVLGKELEEVNFLVSIENGMVTILHPAFREYVQRRVAASGVAPGLHRAVAQIYTESADTHFKVYHLVCAGDGQVVYDELPNAEISAYLAGYVHIARRLFTEDAVLSKQKGNMFRLGYALCHVALIKNDRYGSAAGLRTATIAKKAFDKAGRTEWVRATESTIATFLVNLKRGYEAVDMLKRLAQHFEESGLVHQEAVARTNLSYVYSKLGRIGELETECLRAKKLHNSVGDIFGVAVSLLNLNNVYVARGPNDKILSTCREILRLADKLGSPRLEAGAQNGLTAYYRRKEMYDKAEDAAHKSISIAKQLDDWDLIALNYGNLGNVFRDQGKLPEAKSCHIKVEQIGTKIKSTYHIAHARGRIAEIAEKEGDEKSAIQLGEESIELWDRIGNSYEGASERCKQAERILRFSGFNWKNATSLYKEAVDKYLSAGLKRDAYYSYHRLIEIHLGHLERIEAAETLYEGLSNFDTPDALDYVNHLLGGLSAWDDKSLSYLNIVAISSKACECISPILSKAELFTLIRNTTAAIKRSSSKTEEAYFTLIKDIIYRYQNEKYAHYVTALALAVEQIPPNISSDSITKVFEKIGQLDDEISYRHESWLDDQWCVFFDAPQVPILDFRSGSTISERVVAASAAILVYRQKKLIEDAIGPYGWKRIGLVIQTLDENECRRHGIQVPHFGKDWPVMIPEVATDKFRDDKFTPLLVSNSYLSYADYCMYPTNKSLISLNLQLIDELVKHFTRESFPRRKLTKIRRNIITDVFDVHYKPSKR